MDQRTNDAGTNPESCTLMTSATSQPEDQPRAKTRGDTPDNPKDPVTGTTGNATGEEQAAENEDSRSGRLTRCC